MTKQEYIAEVNAEAISEAADIINRAMRGPYITLTDVTKAEMEYIHRAFNVMNDRIANLEAEIAQLKKDKLEFNAQCFHKDETISVLKNRITELEFDNRSLVEQVNKMALKPNQEVIEWHNYPEEKPERPVGTLIPNPVSQLTLLVKYQTIDGDTYICADEYYWLNEPGFGLEIDVTVLAWAYLPKGVNHE